MVPAPRPVREFEHPAARHARKKDQPSPYPIELISAFYLFLIANIVSALFAPIQDCDETFNYWEPTHYLSHGYGLQTWEYSPTYALRSWLYVGLHAIVGNVRRILPHSTKVGEFYFVRYFLGIACAICQTWLWRTLCLTLNGRIAMTFLFATVLSPGNFISATSYLPSSFAMYMAMLGAATFMNWRGGLRTSQGMYWFGLGAVLGWPFVAALCIPYMLEEMLFAMLAMRSDRERFFEAFVRVSRGIVAALCFMGFDIAINTFFYKEIKMVTVNLIKYNLFSATGGPNLYGTEPWHFYLRNLALNFNVWLPLALLSLPVFLMSKFLSSSRLGFSSGLRVIVFLLPFYLWLAIFSLQPHKEERFMYPVYPFLAVNAAICLHVILSALGSTDPSTLMGKVPARLKLFAVTTLLLLSADLGLARIYGLYSGYSAPLKLYAPLGAGVPGGEQGLGGNGDSVCFGKDWYRLPTSYFLPRGMHARFVRSGFRGLLPGDFAESRTGFGFWSGTWLPTIGLNDRNEEDPGRYVDVLRECRFLVDTQYPERQLRPGYMPDPDEPDYVADTEHWEVVKCIPFLDAESTHVLARALWLPEISALPEKYRRRWGRHCLLRRRDAVPAAGGHGEGKQS